MLAHECTYLPKGNFNAPAIFVIYGLHPHYICCQQRTWQVL